MLLNKIVFWVAVLAATPAFSQVYRCTGDGGQKVFSSSPCGSDAEQLSAEELTPTSGGTLGVPQKQPEMDYQNTDSYGASQSGQSLDRQLIAKRYEDLGSIVDWLVGSDKPALRERLGNEIQLNRARAMRADALHPDWREINVRFDERLEEIQRNHFDDNASLASEWIKLEAERDAAMLLFTPEP